MSDKADKTASPTSVLFAGYSMGQNSPKQEPNSSSLWHRRRLTSPVRTASGNSRSVPDVSQLQGSPVEMKSHAIPITRKRRLSQDLTDASPPFAMASVSSSSSNSSISASSPNMGPRRLSWTPHAEGGHHNSLLDLFNTTHVHGSPRSPALGASSPHHVLSPPIGANFGMSPHALLRQAQLASLAPPELSLPGTAFSPEDVDAKWPVSPNERGHMVLPNGSPPLETLFPGATDKHGLPEAHLISKDEKLKVTRFIPGVSPGASSESGSDTSMVESPVSNTTSLPFSSSPKLAPPERGRTMRRRKRSYRNKGSKGSISSIGSASSGELQDLDLGSSAMDTDMPLPSPPHTRTKQPHLAMPERSGWELTDDDDDELGSSTSESGSDEERPLSDDEEMSDASRQASSRDLRPDQKKLSPLLMMDIEPELASHSHPTSLDPDAERHDAQLFQEKVQEPSPIAHDQSLSPLERIFILSKSEYKDHRSDVSRALPDWLEEVDICEAAEYVLPLLSGLAADDEEVKVGLAQGLDRIMYYFYSKCPLADPEEEGAKNDDMLEDLAQPMEMDEEPAGTHSAQNNSMENATVTVDPPRIPVGAFTPILGLLLMEQHPEVSSWARASVVRFLCRIYDKAIPENLMDEHEHTPEESKNSNKPASSKNTSHEHSPYALTNESKSALEQQILVDVVLGLARLESEDDTQNDSINQVDDTEILSPPTEAAPGRAEPTWGAPLIPQAPNVASTSPEKRDSPDWGMPLRSFVNGASSFSGSTPAGSSRYLTSQMFENDNEAIQGKIASIELISAIASAQCLPDSTLLDVFVPELERMSQDKAFRVRSVAASAMGPMAKSLPTEIVETVLLPLTEVFAKDSNAIVRRWACLTLPDIFSQLSPEQRRQQTSKVVRHMSQDSSRDVRTALTEICGPLIHIFLNEEVPPDLLEWYLGKPFSSSPQAHAPAKFNPLATALSHQRMPSSPTADQQGKRELFSTQNDPERALICAYNFPAVALTLGTQNWSQLREYHSTLANDKQSGVRKSLAASLHAIAEIIGSEQSSRDLPDLFQMFLFDSIDIRECAIEHYADLLKFLPQAQQTSLLVALHQSLYETTTMTVSWRLKEQAALQLVKLAQFFHIGATPPLVNHPLIVLWLSFVKDDTSAVRMAGLASISSIWTALDGQMDRKLFIEKILMPEFAVHTSYRRRSIFVACASAIMVSEGASERFFLDFLSLLEPLAADEIFDVRLAMARFVGAVQQLKRERKENIFNPLFYQIYQRLRQDTSALIREAVGVIDEVSWTNGNRGSSPSPPSSFASSGSHFASDGEEIMSNSLLSNSTIKDLRSLGSKEAEDVWRTISHPTNQQDHNRERQQSSDQEDFVEIDVGSL